MVAASWAEATGNKAMTMSRDRAAFMNAANHKRNETETGTTQSKTAPPVGTTCTSSEILSSFYLNQVADRARGEGRERIEHQTFTLIACTSMSDYGPLSF